MAIVRLLCVNYFGIHSLHAFGMNVLLWLLDLKEVNHRLMIFKTFINLIPFLNCLQALSNEANELLPIFNKTSTRFYRSTIPTGDWSNQSSCMSVRHFVTHNTNGNNKNPHRDQSQPHTARSL